ncbi:MAG: hypothetical protein HGA75_06315 [Thiobacillus sp.]|nr:hypothetical protein [Thiobacillus sp.]
MSVIGTWLIIIGLIIATWQYRDIQGKEIAVGKVTALEPYGSGGRSGQTYRLVANFSDQLGNPHSYRASFGLPSPGYEVGDPIRIYFERENASNCGVLSFGYRFGIAWGFIALGLSFWLLAVGWEFGNGWLENLIPTTVTSN